MSWIILGIAIIRAFSFAIEYTIEIARREEKIIREALSSGQSELYGRIHIWPPSDYMAPSKKENVDWAKEGF
jgi:hypothetical protein